MDCDFKSSRASRSTRGSAVPGLPPLRRQAAVRLRPAAACALLLLSVALVPGGCGHGIGWLVPRRKLEGARDTFASKARPPVVLSHLKRRMVSVYSRKQDRHLRWHGRTVDRYTLGQPDARALILGDSMANTIYPYKAKHDVYSKRIKRWTEKKTVYEKDPYYFRSKGNPCRCYAYKSHDVKVEKRQLVYETTGTEIRTYKLCYRKQPGSRAVPAPGLARELVTTRWDADAAATVVRFKSLGSAFCLRDDHRRKLGNSIPRPVPYPRYQRTFANRVFYITSGGLGYRFTHADWTSSDDSWKIADAQRQHWVVFDIGDVYWGEDLFDLHVRIADLFIKPQRRPNLNRGAALEWLQRLAGTVALMGRRGLAFRTPRFYLGVGAAMGFVHWAAPGEVEEVDETVDSDLSLFGFEIGPTLSVRFPLSRSTPLSLLFFGSYLSSVYGKLSLDYGGITQERNHAGDHHLYGQLLLSWSQSWTNIDLGVWFSYRAIDFDQVTMKGFTVTPIARATFGW